MIHNQKNWSKVCWCKKFDKYNVWRDGLTDQPTNNGILGVGELNPFQIYSFREATKKITVGNLSQMWVGGVAVSQTRSKPLKKNQITPKIAFFDPNFTFRFSKSHKNPGVGGWVNTFGKDLPKKRFFFYTFPYCFLEVIIYLIISGIKELYHSFSPFSAPHHILHISQLLFLFFPCVGIAM